MKGRWGGIVILGVERYRGNDASLLFESGKEVIVFGYGRPVSGTLLSRMVGIEQNVNRGTIEVNWKSLQYLF